MAENFYTIITDIGLAKIANSQVTGTKVNFTEMAIGDGGVAYYNPTSRTTALRNEVWRGPIGSISADENNANWIVNDTVIPATVGGFFVREVGIFDDAGDLIAIGKYPETYKPIIADGSSKDLYIRMIIEVANAASITLKVDPAVVIATRKYVDEKIAQGIGTVGGTIDAIKDGSLTIPSLETDVKTLAGSINEVSAYAKLSKEELQLELQTLQQKLGELSTLDTESQADLVSAINEIVAAIDAHLADYTTHVDDYVKHPAYASTTGVNNYLVTLTPSPIALLEGMGLVVKVGVSATGACTINVNALGVKNILKTDGTPVDNLKANSVYTLRYNGTSFILQGEGGGDSKKEISVYVKSATREERAFYQDDKNIYTTEVYNDAGTFRWYGKEYSRNTGLISRALEFTELNLNNPHTDLQFSYTENGIVEINNTVQGLRTYNKNKILTKYVAGFPAISRIGIAMHGRNLEEIVIFHSASIALYSINGVFVGTVLSGSSTTIQNFNIYKKKSGEIEAIANTQSSTSYYYKDLLGLELRMTNANYTNMTPLYMKSVFTSYIAQLIYSK